MDRNNKVPYFVGITENGRYSGSVFENTKAGATVIEVNGDDDDKTSAYNTVSFVLFCSGSKK